MIRCAAVFLGVLAAGAVHAADPSLGARFLSVPVSVRQMAMGEVAIGDPDVLRTWANPASLGLIESRAQISVNGGSADRETDGALAGGGGVRLTPSLALGGMVSLHRVSFDEVDAAGVTGAAVGRTSASFGVSGAWSWRWLSAGTTVKLVSESSEQDSEKLSAGAADAGVLATLSGFSAGASVCNAGGLLHAADAELPGGVALPLEVRGGLAYRWPSFLAAAEFVTGSGPGLGFTAWASPELAVRAGIARPGRADRAITAGFSALLVKVGKLQNIGVDYAVSWQAPDALHRLNLSVAFGALPGASPAK